MRTNMKIVLISVFSAAAGALAVHGLHAQAKPMGYVISEIDVSDAEGFKKEFRALAMKALTDAGGKTLVHTGRTATISGEPPKDHIEVWQFETMEQAEAAFASPAYLEAKKIGDKYAAIRAFAAQGVKPQ